MYSGKECRSEHRHQPNHCHDHLYRNRQNQQT